MKKRCNVCEKELATAMFYWNENRRQFAPTCKVCARQRAKESRMKAKAKPERVQKYADQVVSELNGADY